jgi:hypothetical protein
MPMPQHWLPPAEVAKAFDIDERRFSQLARVADLQHSANELLDRQRETSDDAEAVAALVDEVCRADGS